MLCKMRQAKGLSMIDPCVLESVQGEGFGIGSVSLLRDLVFMQARQVAWASFVRLERINVSDM